MMRTSLSILTILVVGNSANMSTRDPSASEIKEAFRLAMIVPQIIPVAPKTFLTKIYNDYYMNLGNRIPPCAILPLPFTTFPNSDPKHLYLIIGLDPDSIQFFKSGPTQLLFELIVNIPGGDFASGERIVPFRPPAPLFGSGDHRIIYLIYKQPARINVTTELLVSMSTNFDRFFIADFVEQFDLGNPIAGNFYVTRQNSCCCKMENKEYKSGKNYCEHKALDDCNLCYAN